jgi:hypothetical protein
MCTSLHNMKPHEPCCRLHAPMPYTPIRTFHEREGRGGGGGASSAAAPELDPVGPLEGVCIFFSLAIATSKRSRSFCGKRFGGNYERERAEGRGEAAMSDELFEDVCMWRLPSSLEGKVKKKRWVQSRGIGVHVYL